MTIPEGYEPFPTSSPFNTAVGPYYYRLQGESLVMGLEVETRHCNTGGTLHGAMFSALADIALGNSIGLALSEGSAEAGVAARKDGAPPVSFATINLSVDYAGAAKVGDWVEMHTEVQKVGGTLAYANGYLMNGNDRIGRVSGIYRLFSR